MYQAILIDHQPLAGKAQLLSSFHRISTTVLNKPLFVHLIESLKEQGINRFILVTDETLSREYRDGSRWGVDLEIADRLNLSHFQNEYEQSIILAANVIHELKFAKLARFHSKSSSRISRALPADRRQRRSDVYFDPTLVDSMLIGEYIHHHGPLTVEGLKNLIHRKPDQVAEVQGVSKVTALNSHRDYLAVHAEHLRGTVKTDRLQGYPLKEDLWVGLDTRVDDEVESQGFTLIGQNCKIARDVKLKGFVVIEDDVVIDRGTTLTNSVVRKGTYVGRDLSLEDALVNSKMIYNARLNSVVHVEDSFIVGASHGRRVRRKMLQNVARSSL